MRPTGPLSPSGSSIWSALPRKLTFDDCGVMPPSYIPSSYEASLCMILLASAAISRTISPAACALDTKPTL